MSPFLIETIKNPVDYPAKSQPPKETYQYYGDPPWSYLLIRRSDTPSNNETQSTGTDPAVKSVTESPGDQ